MAARAGYDTGERRWGSYDDEERYDAPDEHGDCHYTDSMTDGSLQFDDNAARLPGPSLDAHYEENTEMTGTTTYRAQANAGPEPTNWMDYTQDDTQDYNYTHGSIRDGDGSISATHGQGPRAIPSWSAAQAYGHDDSRGHQQPRRRHQERRRPQRKQGSRSGASSLNPRNDPSYGTRNADVYRNPDHYNEQAIVPPESSQSRDQMAPEFYGQDWPSNNTYQSEDYQQRPHDVDIDQLVEQQPALSYDYGPAYGPGPGLPEIIPQPLHYPTRGHQANKPRLTRNMTVEHSDLFRPGRIMMVDWTEPRGYKIGTTILTGGAENFYRKNRRFIIVSTLKGHSQCLTYGGRGCTKPGSHNEVHGIIYSLGRNPDLLPGEGGLGFDPVCMIPDNATEQLDGASRVDYSKVYSIEHNYAVSFIGRLSDSDLGTVRQAVDFIRQETYATGQFQYM